MHQLGARIASYASANPPLLFSLSLSSLLSPALSPLAAQASEWECGSGRLGVGRDDSHELGVFQGNKSASPFRAFTDVPLSVNGCDLVVLGADGLDPPFVG